MNKLLKLLKLNWNFSKLILIILLSAEKEKKINLQEFPRISAENVWETWHLEISQKVKYINKNWEIIMLDDRILIW